jgi:hypothetical protein
MNVFEDQERLTVEIAPTRRWKDVSRDCWMLALWGAMALGLMRIAPPSQVISQYAVSVVERLALLMLCLMGVLRLAWRLCGREEIVMGNGLLNVIWRLGLLAWQRNYETGHVRDLHVAGIGLPRYWGVTGGTLEFQYKAKTARFADRLSRDEATQLLKHFRDRLPQSNWTPVLGL